MNLYFALKHRKKEYYALLNKAKLQKSKSKGLTRILKAMVITVVIISGVFGYYLYSLYNNAQFHPGPAIILGYGAFNVQPLPGRNISLLASFVNFTSPTSYYGMNGAPVTITLNNFLSSQLFASGTTSHECVSTPCEDGIFFFSFIPSQNGTYTFQAHTGPYASPTLTIRVG